MKPVAIIIDNHDEIQYVQDWNTLLQLQKEGKVKDIFLKYSKRRGSDERFSPEIRRQEDGND